MATDKQGDHAALDVGNRSFHSHESLSNQRTIAISQGLRMLTILTVEFRGVSHIWNFDQQFKCSTIWFQVCKQCFIQIERDRCSTQIEGAFLVQTTCADKAPTPVVQGLWRVLYEQLLLHCTLNQLQLVPNPGRWYSNL